MFFFSNVFLLFLTGWEYFSVIAVIISIWINEFVSNVLVMLGMCNSKIRTKIYFQQQRLIKSVLGLYLVYLLAILVCAVSNNPVFKL